eukprot:TRINITY_DN58455_c0_g1_i1.p2 TRINITY_DN58455_c0_g1~~TRINITY_DN58455_c0_g1_i1.p2  ORF type:complete len:155 (+),score=22.76 TRINITY_DN58455_c0_g1_i1:324-788(+)
MLEFARDVKCRPLALRMLEHMSQRNVSMDHESYHLLFACFHENKDFVGVLVQHMLASGLQPNPETWRTLFNSGCHGHLASLCVDATVAATQQSQKRAAAGRRASPKGEGAAAKADAPPKGVRIAMLPDTAAGSSDADRPASGNNSDADAELRRR